MYCEPLSWRMVNPVATSSPMTPMHSEAPPSGPLPTLRSACLGGRMLNRRNSPNNGRPPRRRRPAAPCQERSLSRRCPTSHRRPMACKQPLREVPRASRKIKNPSKQPLQASRGSIPHSTFKGNDWIQPTISSSMEYRADWRSSMSKRLLRLWRKTERFICGSWSKNAVMGIRYKPSGAASSRSIGTQSCSAPPR